MFPQNGGFMSEFEKDVLVASLAEQHLSINNQDNLIIVCKKIKCRFNESKNDLRKIFHCTHAIVRKKYLELYDVLISGGKK
jgi:hypothetical protein